MIRLAISVEGQTEESFVRVVLTERLRSRKIEPYPILFGRARSGGVGGGNVSVERLVLEMVRLSSSFDGVTSLVDYYGFRDKGTRSVEELEKHLVEEVGKRISSVGKVYPYVQIHEFEGLLFSDVTAFQGIGPATSDSIETLFAIRSQFATPEDINDDPNGAPSRRIANILPGYRKRLHGPMIARTTGLAKIREECPRFHAWLARLEGMAGQV